MFYSIGLFVVDSEKEILFLKSTSDVVTNNARAVRLISHLCAAYPKAVSKAELLRNLWPNDDVTEWSLSRLVSRTRQLLSTYDKTDYIQTVHAQGFKLAIAPLVVESVEPLVSKPNVGKVVEIVDSIKNLDGVTDPETPVVGNQNVISKRHLPALSLYALGVCVFIGLLFIAIGYYFFGQKNPVSSAVNFGTMYPEEIIELPVNSNWVTSKAGTIKFTEDGLLIEPISDEIFFVSTPIFRRVFLQGAVFTLQIEVSRDFMEHGGWLGPYFQTKRDNWPGAWDCGIFGKNLKSPNVEYDCLIDQNESFTNVLANEEVVFGIKTHQQQGIGSALVKSAKVKILPSVDTAGGWHTTEDKLPIVYDRGVSYRPESVEQTLSALIKGPLNINGSELAFTIEIDSEVKQYYTAIELFLIDKNKLWKNCSVFVGEIKSKVFTSRCKFNSQNPFVLNANEKIEIGIRPNGKILAGEIKIIGITVTD
jgi:DNA-binding winged helix-turn-helix (wHTH) protein